MSTAADDERENGWDNNEDDEDDADDDDAVDDESIGIAQKAYIYCGFRNCWYMNSSKSL